MKKKLAISVLAFTAMLSTAAYAKTIKLQVGTTDIVENGTITQIDSPPVIKNERTLVPISAIVKALEGSADWDADTKTATLTSKYGDVVKLTIGSKTAYCNDTASELDTEPVIINDRTMLPIHFVAESFGYVTDWEPSLKLITVSSGVDVEGTLNSEEGEKYTCYDKDGNSYTEINAVSEEFGTRIYVKSKDGKELGKYVLADEMQEIYKDADGKEAIFSVSEDSGIHFIIDGKEEKLVFNGSFEYEDEKGNIYDNSELNLLVIKDKIGKKIAEYTYTQEMRYLYVDENGNAAYKVNMKDGTYIDGFMFPDGKFAAYVNDYHEKYKGSDGKNYNVKYDYLILTDESQNITDEWKALPEGSDMIYVGKDGTEYIVTGDFAESYLLKSTNKQIKLTCDPEEEHNKVLFAGESYGTEDAVYYSGDDGNTYVGKDNIFTVYDPLGNVIDTIPLTRQDERYKTKDGKTVVFSSMFEDDKCYITTDSEKIDLELVEN